MFSAAPFAARPAPSLAVAVACLSLVGCGNRGELYLPSEAELGVDGLASERSLPDVEEDIEREGRAVTPSDTVNGLTPSGTGDDEEIEREDEGGNGDSGGDAPGAVVGDGR